MTEYGKRIEQINIFTALVEKYGDKQINICIEEMSELTKELCKNVRGHGNLDKIYEEMADVFIMLAQMQILFQMDVEVLDNIIYQKTKRAKERLL
jgi:NTP pyrophosphatase (non-canonical NTP hydrolase)